MNRLTVLYPFIEESVNDQTEAFIEEIAWLKKSRNIDVLITVNKTGRISDMLKKAKLDYEIVEFNFPVKTNDFYLKALFRLMRSSLPVFFYFRARRFNVVHCPDLTSLLCWGNTARMNRVRFIASISDAGKLSHYTTLMLKDASKLICQTAAAREKLPSRFSAGALLAPRAMNVPENLEANTAKQHAVGFWTDLYASLFHTVDKNKLTGLLNK